MTKRKQRKPTLSDFMPSEEELSKLRLEGLFKAYDKAEADYEQALEKWGRVVAYEKKVLGEEE